MMKIEAGKRYLVYLAGVVLIIGSFVMAIVGAFTAGNGVGHKLNEIGCESDYGSNCDVNSNGIIDRAELATTTPIAANTQKLDNLDSTDFCRKNGANCPAPTSSLSCVYEYKSVSNVDLVSVPCPSGYTVTGGGCSIDGDYTIFFLSKKNSNGWKCQRWDDPQTPGMTAYAVCCKV